MSLTQSQEEALQAEVVPQAAVATAQPRRQAPIAYSYGCAAVRASLLGRGSSGCNRQAAHRLGEGRFVSMHCVPPQTIAELGLAICIDSTPVGME